MIILDEVHTMIFFFGVFLLLSGFKASLTSTVGAHGREGCQRICCIPWICCQEGNLSAVVIIHCLDMNVFEDLINMQMKTGSS